ncbi:MAG: sugar ABC transporter substrate-binding protein [Chloroflexi bacterium HGW-Chloroflexi-7]|nr:MAG: sugar ABC transporter substrate-binding protein [Chloroflexi bacterium HGW-Chloroflexi-7]
MKKFLRIILVCVLLLLTIVISYGYAEEHPLKGQSIKMSILGIGGWLPSRLGVDMSPLFAEYAKNKYGYNVTFTFQEAPFSALFQKAATSLATKSQEYNLIISDSQWLGAFAEPGWIVNVSDLIKEEPELDIEWYDPVIVKTYMVYPDGSDQLWGLPEEGDVIILYVRQDLFSDPGEQKAFKEKYDWDLPQTFEDWEAVTMDKFMKITEFFTRPAKGLWGTAMQYQKEYDFMTMYLYPFMFSLGGDIWNQETREIYGVLNSDVNARAMEWNREMLKFMPPGALNYGISEEVDAFTQGKLATAFMWAAVGASMISPGLEGKVLCVPPPAFTRDDGTTSRIYSIGGQPWVINAYNDDAHMRVAIDFLKWWYQPETQLEYAKRGGNPTDKATMEMAGFEDINPWNRAYKYMIITERARDFWHEPKYSELLAVQQEGWTAYAAGQVNDAVNTLEWIACEQQKILFEAGRSEVAPPDSCKKCRLDK